MTTAEGNCYGRTIFDDNACKDLDEPTCINKHIRGKKRCIWEPDTTFEGTSGGTCSGKIPIDDNVCKNLDENRCIEKTNWFGRKQCNWTPGTTSEGTCSGKIPIDDNICKNLDENRCIEKIGLGENNVIGHQEPLLKVRVLVKYLLTIIFVKI